MTKQISAVFAPFRASFKKALALSCLGLCATAQAQDVSLLSPGKAAASGLRFTCSAEKRPRFEADMAGYLKQLDIAPRYVNMTADADSVTYSLNTPGEDVDTLDLFDRPEYRLSDAVVRLPLKNGKSRAVTTSSEKEIVLALMQHGRRTDFGPSACDIEALKDHVGVRQNTVAWAEVLEFGWPDGGAAKWNTKYWKHGTPTKGHALHTAVNDMFMNQSKYEIGCYTATKMVMVQGVLDYYHRIKKDPEMVRAVEARLAQDGEPLANVEPGRVWDFEADFDSAERARPGKILGVQYGVAAKNFVPGDWAYLLNTDPVTYEKTGYEGSNAIYLGRNKFDDYYNDHSHAYSYRQKLHEVYQWRNKVFSASRDANKVQPLSASDIERLGHTPAAGGIVLSWRVAPYQFGYEELPAWDFKY